MCLAVPGKILSVEGEGFGRTARISFGATVCGVSLAHVPEAVAGDYVIVHAGFAISRVDESEALRTLQYIQQMDEMAVR